MRLLFLHRALGVHLRLADLALLVFDRDFRVQLVLADGAFLLHCGIAACADGFVGFLHQPLPRFGLQRARSVGRRLYGEDRNSEHLQPKRCKLRCREQVLAQRHHELLRGAQRIAQTELLDLRASQNVNEIHHALRKFLRVVGRIAASIGRQGEIEQRRELFRIAHAVGHLALQRHGLIIRRLLLENKRHIRARHRHRHKRSARREIKERHPRTFADDFSTLILDEVSGRLDFDELNSEHGLCGWLVVGLTRQ